jgi:hypothetical protein
VSFKVAAQVFSIGIAVLLLSACTATRTSLIDVKATIEPSSSEKAYKAIVMTLLDKGFDLKMNDRDLRVTTTEYRKYASAGVWPPFDFYLQMKAVVRDTPDGRYQIALTPKIKEQNRINASAFTEHALIMYSEKEQKEDYATQSGGGKAMLEGQLLFLSIVQGIADVLGIPADQFKQNLQQTKVFGK